MLANGRIRSVKAIFIGMRSRVVSRDPGITCGPSYMRYRERETQLRRLRRIFLFGEEKTEEGETRPAGRVFARDPAGRVCFPRGEDNFGNLAIIDRNGNA